jgi:hypothetical protein
MAETAMTVECEAMTSLTALASGPGRWTATVVAYSTSAPTVRRTLNKVTVETSLPEAGGIGVRWADASGTRMIIDWTGMEDATSRQLLHFGVLIPAKFIPLPSPPGGADPSGYGIAW